MRAGFAAPDVFVALVERLAVERLAAGLRAEDARLAPFAAGLARELVERLAVELFFAVERLAVERLAAGLRAEDPLDEVFRAAGASPPHLPLMTRCAASATASAINDPSLVALDIMLLAADDALSAASRPASRIARRALGLALIAAAAAASPAASISLLIAAFASLSTVSDELDDERDELFFADFAISVSPASREIAL